MGTPKLSLHDGTTERGSKRQKRVDIMKIFTEEGWAIIEKGKKLYKMGKNDQELQYPIHTRIFLSCPMKLLNTIILISFSNFN